MPYIIKVASREFKLLNIFGNDYDTPDGTGIRDYIHVLDLVSGHIAAIKALMKKTQIITVNLGTGTGYSVIDVVKSFEKVSQQKIIFKFLERREGDVAISYADPKLAKVLLNWEAKYSLEDMCSDSWNYKLNNFW